MQGPLPVMKLASHRGWRSHAGPASRQPCRPCVSTALTVLLPLRTAAQRSLQAAKDLTKTVLVNGHCACMKRI